MPYCPNCGTQNTDIAKFCINCGAAMPGVTTEQKPVTQPSPVSSGVGSKVSFVASDGKTYTGTITEIRGDQYKIKYDAFDFETWLGKNQVTITSGNTVLPTSTPVPQTAPPQVTVTSTVARAAAPGTAPAFVTHLGLWGSLMIIVGFFTNWISADYGGISGLRILTAASDIVNSPHDTDHVWTVTVGVIGIILLSAVVCFLYVVGVGIGKGAFSFFKIVPLLVLTGLVVYAIIKGQQTGNYENDDPLIAYDDPFIQHFESWRVLGIGLYLTALGALVLAISRSRR